MVEVHNACPQTCGLCCADDASYTFPTTNSGDQDCDWLGKKQVRIETYCDQWLGGQNVKNGCPLTCGLCQDYVSVAPSVSP